MEGFLGFPGMVMTKMMLVATPRPWEVCVKAATFAESDNASHQSLQRTADFSDARKPRAGGTKEGLSGFKDLPSPLNKEKSTKQSNGRIYALEIEARTQHTE